MAETISAIHSVNFAATLTTLLDAMLEFDCVVILGCRNDKHPVYLHDSLKDNRDLLFELYLKSSFNEDPFFRYFSKRKKSGVFMLSDLNIDRTDYNSYCRHFYHQTGWKDELGMMINVSDSKSILFCFGSIRKATRFTRQNTELLTRHFTVIEAICQKHWGQTEFIFSESVYNPTQQTDNMRQLISAALATFGQSILTPREQEISMLIAKGCDSKEIAVATGISEGTVKNHRKRIYKQLNVKSLSEFFQLFLNHLITHAK